MSINNQLVINAVWDNNLVPAGRSAQRNLLIEVTAPSKPEQVSERQPINLALVIDCSGSMTGAPIEAACRAAEGIVDCLKEGDCLSLVTFNQATDTLFSGLMMNEQGKHEASELIHRIYAGGITNLSAGWFEGSRCVASEGHVLVLSDGRANRGICDPDELLYHARELARRNVKTSAAGIGMRYSPLQLDALAEGGQGRLHDADSTADIVDVVLGELGELHTITARGVGLSLEYPLVANLEPITRMAVNHEPGKYSLQIGDIVADATRAFAVSVNLPRLEQGEQLLFDGAVSWRESTDQISSTTHSFETKLFVVPPFEADNHIPEYDVIERIADLWEATLAYRALRQNEQGDYAGASLSYTTQFAAFENLVKDLHSAPLRLKRFASAQRRVSMEWRGRSKRQAYTLSKKAILSERDLRSRDVGNWYNHLE